MHVFCDPDPEKAALLRQMQELQAKLAAMWMPVVDATDHRAAAVVKDQANTQHWKHDGRWPVTVTKDQVGEHLAMKTW